MDGSLRILYICWHLVYTGRAFVKMVSSEKKVMKQHIAHIALVVRDYDDAIQFYTQKLHFTLVEDTVLSETKRWVLVAPKGSNECYLLLAKATNREQETRVGDQ